MQTQKSSLLWVDCRLVNVQGISPLESLSAHLTVVDKHSWKMDCFQVISDFGRQLGFENIAN